MSPKNKKFGKEMGFEKKENMNIMGSDGSIPGDAPTMSTMTSSIKPSSIMSSGGSNPSSQNSIPSQTS